MARHSRPWLPLCGKEQLVAWGFLLRLFQQTLQIQLDGLASNYLASCLAPRHALALTIPVGRGRKATFRTCEYVVHANISLVNVWADSKTGALWSKNIP